MCHAFAVGTESSVIRDLIVELLQIRLNLHQGQARAMVCNHLVPNAMRSLQ
jgi:hypothetical protein